MKLGSAPTSRSLLPAALLAALLVSAAAPASAAGDGAATAYYTRPGAAASGDTLYLIYQQGTMAEPADDFCVASKAAGGEWTAPLAYNGRYNAIASLGGKLWIFFPDRWAEFGDDGKLDMHDDWPYPWEPKSACTVGDEVWVFGLFEGIAGARTSTGVEWQAIPGPPQVPADLVAVHCVPAGDGAMVSFVCAMGGGRSAWSQAVFDGAAWSKPSLGLTIERTYSYTFAAVDDKVLFLARQRETSPLTRQPVRWQTWDGESWSAPRESETLRDTLLQKTTHMGACADGDELHLFLSGVGNLRHATWDGDRWSAPEMLPGISAMALWYYWVFLIWIGSIPISIIAIGVVMLLRRRPIHTISLGGRDLRLASSPRRMAAYGIDLMIVLSAANLIVWVLGDAALTLLFGLYVAYFSVLELLRGQTVGKRLLGIVVITAQCAPPGLGSALTRNLLRPVDDWAACLLGLFMMIATRRSQRVGDLAAKTYVVEVTSLIATQPQPAEGTDHDTV